MRPIKKSRSLKLPKSILEEIGESGKLFLIDLVSIFNQIDRFKC